MQAWLLFNSKDIRNMKVLKLKKEKISEFEFVYTSYNNILDYQNKKSIVCFIHIWNPTTFFSQWGWVIGNHEIKNEFFSIKNKVFAADCCFVDDLECVGFGIVGWPADRG